MRRATRGAGAKLLFLLPYSPYLDPIERVFAKRKTLLRNAAEFTRGASAPSSNTLCQQNAPTTSELQVMLHSKTNVV